MLKRVFGKIKNVVLVDNYTEIISSIQFGNIVISQGAREVYSIKEVEKLVYEFQSENKNYTIFTHKDENDGSDSYISYGIGSVNVIGYFVLEGNFTLPYELDY